MYALLFLPFPCSLPRSWLALTCSKSNVPSQGNLPLIPPFLGSTHRRVARRIVCVSNASILKGTLGCQSSLMWFVAGISKRLKSDCYMATIPTKQLVQVHSSVIQAKPTKYGVCHTDWSLTNFSSEAYFGACSLLVAWIWARPCLEKVTVPTRPYSWVPQKLLDGCSAKSMSLLCWLDHTIYIYILWNNW